MWRSTQSRCPMCCVNTHPWTAQCLILFSSCLVPQAFLRLSAMMSLHSATWAQGIVSCFLPFFVTKYLCWSSSGIAHWIGTLLSSDDVLLKPRPPCLIQACAHIRLERSGEADPFPSHCSHAGRVTPLETAAMLQHNRWHVGPLSRLLGVGKERGLCWHCKLFLKQKESQLAPPLSCRKEQERAVIWHMYSGAWVCEFMSTFTAC